MITHKNEHRKVEEYFYGEFSHKEIVEIRCAGKHMD